MALHEMKEAEGGTLLDYTNETDALQDTHCASLTARGVVRCEVIVYETDGRMKDGRPHDVVFAGNGGSHTWWTGAGNRFLPLQGLFPGERLLVMVDGPAALRIDWC